MNRVMAALLAAGIALSVPACAQSREWIVTSKLYVNAQNSNNGKPFYTVTCADKDNLRATKSGRVEKSVWDKVQKGQTCPTLR